MKVQIPGLLGGTLLHWRHPPDLVCADALPTDERAAQLAQNAGVRVRDALWRPKPPIDSGTVAVSRTMSG